LREIQNTQRKIWRNLNKCFLSRFSKDYTLRQWTVARRNSWDVERSEWSTKTWAWQNYLREDKLHFSFGDGGNSWSESIPRSVGSRPNPLLGRASWTFFHPIAVDIAAAGNFLVTCWKGRTIPNKNWSALEEPVSSLCWWIFWPNSWEEIR